MSTDTTTITPDQIARLASQAITLLANPEAFATVGDHPVPRPTSARWVGGVNGRVEWLDDSGQVTTTATRREIDANWHRLPRFTEATHYTEWAHSAADITPALDVMLTLVHCGPDAASPDWTPIRRGRPSTGRRIDVRLPDDTRDSIRQHAERLHTSEAEIIRILVQHALADPGLDWGRWVQRDT